MLTRGTGTLAALAMGVAGLWAGVSPGQAETTGAARSKPPRPSVTRLAPASAPIAGGTKVTVKGKHLTGARKVLFGTTKGRKVTVKNAHKLTVVVPPHAAGTVDVRVVTKGGRSAKTSQGRFTFVAPVPPPPPPPPPPTDPTAETAPLPPDASAASNTELNDVACPAAGDCFAVGAYDTGTTRAALIEHLVGGSWQAISPPSPDPDATTARLVGVSCTSDTFCVAAGSYTAGGVRSPYVETWDGSGWSVTGLSLPVGGTTLDGVQGISCDGTTTCALVGYYETASGTRGLLETFDAGNWLESSAPLPAGADATSAFLNGVDCYGDRACLAVGTYSDSTGGSFPWAVTLSFSTWSSSPLPRLEPADVTQNSLQSVSCTSATACAAVGFFEDVDGIDSAVVETLVGTNWFVADVPALGSGTNPSASLSDVACSDTTCLAGGLYGDDQVGQRAMLVTIDGTGVDGHDVSLTSPDPAGPFAQVMSVGCTPGGACAGVGAYNVTTGTVGLLTHMTGGAAVGVQSPQPAGASGIGLVALATSTSSLGVAVGTYDTSDQVTHGLLVTNVPLS